MTDTSVGLIGDIGATNALREKLKAFKSPAP